MKENYFINLKTLCGCDGSYYEVIMMWCEKECFLNVRSVLKDFKHIEKFLTSRFIKKRLNFLQFTVVLK